MDDLNTFQRWACDYARAYGFPARPFCNWVIVTRDGQDIEVMTAQGLQDLCATVAPAFREEPTAAGIQLVIPGCERRPVDNGKPAQLSLWG